MNLKNALLLILSLLLLSCGSKEDFDNIDTDVIFSGTKWQIVELSGNPVKDNINTKTPYFYFDSKENYYGATTGCNIWSGKFELKNKTLRLEPGTSTLAACVDVPLEDGFEQILTSINYYRFDNDYLYLLANNEVVAKLKRMNDNSVL